MSTDPQYLTSLKFEELKKELEYLKSERRKEVAEHLEYSKKLGDLSENAEYHQAREEQAEVEERINKVEALLKNASIVGEGRSDIIIVGTTVRLQKEGDNKSYLYTIVGSEEADMAHGKISNMSPIGAALIGRKKGDIVSVNTPNGIVKYSIEVLK
ncbi:MAG: transcription elongation factor GreA [Candidatus Paceibacterota bacterium]|jgi:transcription elongation factor GreA